MQSYYSGRFCILPPSNELIFNLYESQIDLMTCSANTDLPKNHALLAATPGYWNLNTIYFFMTELYGGIFAGKIFATVKLMSQEKF